MAAVVITIVTTTVLGLPLAILLDRRTSGALLLGLSFLYGSALVFAVMLLLDVAGARWSLPLVTGAALAIAAAAWFASRRTAAPVAEVPPRQRPSWIDALTAVVVVAYALFATAAPLWQWDFWAIWGLKARIFFERGGIDWRFLESHWNEFAHPDYPMLLPLNLVFTAMWHGAWDDRWLGLLFVAWGLATVLIVRSFAARELPPSFAAAIGLAATSFGISRYVGLAEGPLVAYATAGLLMIRQALADDDSVAMRNGAILLGFAASCKNEGLALVASAALALLVADWRRWRRVLRLWPAVAIAAPWKILAATHGLQVDLAEGSVFGRLVQRLGAADAIFAGLLTELADRWIWLALLIGILVLPAAARKRERFLFAAIGVQLAVYVAIYFSTVRDVMWHIATSWPRLTRQLGTPILFAVLLLLAREYLAKDERHAEARSQQ